MTSPFRPLSPNSAFGYRVSSLSAELQGNREGGTSAWKYVCLSGALAADLATELPRRRSAPGEASRSPSQRGHGTGRRVRPDRTGRCCARPGQVARRRPSMRERFEDCATAECGLRPPAEPARRPRRLPVLSIFRLLVHGFWLAQRPTAWEGSTVVMGGFGCLEPRSHCFVEQLPQLDARSAMF